MKKDEKKMYGKGGRAKAMAGGMKREKTMYGGMKKMSKGGVATSMTTARPN
jgi:hypothetical protein